MDSKVTFGGRFLRVDGIQVYFEEFGTGMPLVLVHGLGGRHMWRRLIPALGSSFRVIAVDLPGFGKSENPSGHFTAEMYALFLLRLFDILGLKTVSLCGVSYGGEISLKFSLMFPARTERLVLVSSTGLQGRRVLFSNRVSWSIIGFIAKHIVLRSEMLSCLIAQRSFADISRRPQDLCAVVHQDIMQEGKRDRWLECFREVLSGSGHAVRLRNLNIPVLIAWGREDRTVPLRFGEEFHRLIPGSRFVVFKGCAHSVPLECPEELAAAILGFSQPSIQ